MPLLSNRKILLVTLLLLWSGASSALSVEQILGQKLFTDMNFSINRNQSCESCHSLASLKVPSESRRGRLALRKQPSPGFVDPENVQNGTSVANGSLLRKFGSLNPPSVGYAGFSPEFHWDGELFIGGQFWNGRAKDLVAQAKGPFLNPVEMAMPTEWSVIARLKEKSVYRGLFRRIYNIDIKRIEQEDGAKITQAFDAMAKAISAFEKSSIFNRFDSKFDYEAAGITAYNESEQRGADLFDGNAQCGLCHTTEGIAGDNTPSLLTDFSYDNLGVPYNPQIPGNPEADTGLLGNLNLDFVRGASSLASEIEGRHKVMSLRNIELTAPYMHNGVFKTLEEVVHFYNTRDVLPECSEPSDVTHIGFGVTCWPKGEFQATRNVEELGDLGLSEQGEADLVAYLKTFTDNYPRWGNSNGKRDRNVSRGSKSPYLGFLP